MINCRLYLCGVLFCACVLSLFSLGEGEPVPLGESRIITDMAGRDVAVPSEIKTVLGKSPMGTLLVYTLEPDALVGWNYRFTEGEQRFIPDPYGDLPVVGGWFGKKNTANLEEIIRLAPDVIIDSDYINENTIGSNDALQEQLGIPIVMVDGGNMDALPAVFRYLGQLLDCPEEGDIRADYCERILKEADKNTAGLAMGQRISVYYAEGADGLQTEPRGSLHTQLIPLAGGINAADGGAALEGESVNMARISLEQILLWDPQVIITPAESSGGDSFYETLETRPGWKDVDAVREGRIYPIPQNPFGWFDRPPSVNRIVGIGWLSRLLHPSLFDSSMEEEVRIFYRMFYHYDLSEGELASLLGRSLSDPVGESLP